MVKTSFQDDLPIQITILCKKQFISNNEDCVSAHQTRYRYQESKSQIHHRCDQKSVVTLAQLHSVIVKYAWLNSSRSTHLPLKSVLRSLIAKLHESRFTTYLKNEVLTGIITHDCSRTAKSAEVDSMQNLQDNRNQIII